jgi:hypothetical protein
VKLRCVRVNNRKRQLELETRSGPVLPVPFARRLGTSVPQLYRLLDPANSRKSFVQLVALLDMLDCEVRVSVRRRRAA